MPQAFAPIGTNPPLTAEDYQALMDAGFRRSGIAVYRTACDSCRECVPIRVPVATFRPSRSQRRAERRNRDVSVQIGKPQPDDEKYSIFEAYQRDHHASNPVESREEFEAFLYQSPVHSLEMVYRVGSAVAGVGIVDIASQSLSSVYFYFDPAHARRSLGTFSALKEIDLCRQMGKPYWYAGYYIRECDRMNYKAAFGPYQLLDQHGQWKPSEEPL
ncbi:MAG: hypothetical protein HBSAPP02_07890 [Phycisphaerae bacterium]|nr:MAG: hypothetical protein HBSAPP02_07890 [Phycisphaerae bacterium]